MDSLIFFQNKIIYQKYHIYYLDVISKVKVFFFKIDQIQGSQGQLENRHGQQ